MKILLVSYTFAPNVGGIETMSALLAEGFASAGHEVRIATYTPGEPVRTGACPIIRRPSAHRLWHLFVWSDLVVHSNITLRAIWPLLFLRRPWVVIHHTWIVFPDQPIHRALWLKLLTLHIGFSICVSRALARHLPVSALVIPNACDARLFRSTAPGPRSRDLIFVGRLVSDKGVDLLLHAVARLNTRGLAPTLTIIGAGVEEQPLRSLARQLGLPHVDFVGAQPAAAVARTLAEHRVAVIPSRWQEPFGVVALEALASGCTVVASDAGGLPEAIGACGLTFRNGDVESLAEALLRALAGNASPAPAALTAHLARHHPTRIVGDYLRVFSRLLAPAPSFP